MPDSWFRLAYGPYSGDSPFWKVKDYPGYDRLFEDGRIGGDDDYHVDFFSQLIFDRYGTNPVYQQMWDAWVRHQVSNWGGNIAMQQMIAAMLLPLTGLAEFNQRLRRATQGDGRSVDHATGRVVPDMLPPAPCGVCPFWQNCLTLMQKTEPINAAGINKPSRNE
jgi:hypothetical protein